MKSRTILSGITAVLLTTGIPALADTPPDLSNTDDTTQEAQEPTLVDQELVHNQALAHKMMGHINLAQLALDLGLGDEAKKQIQEAHNLETVLSAQMPQLTIRSTFKYGKVTHDGTSTISEHYIPIVDDVFLVGDYEAIFNGEKAEDINETAAAIKHVGISVDLREVDAALTKAAGALAEGGLADASRVLHDVFTGAIYDEEEVDDPKLAILENLALARSFVEHERYDSARLSLEHVEDRVKRAKKANLSHIDQVSLNKFTSDLNAIRAELRKKDPTLGERISDRLSNWSNAVKGWFN